MNNEKLEGVLAIIIANTIFGLNIPVTRELMASWMSPIGYTASRMFFGAIVFWLISLLYPKEKITRRDFGIILLGGLLGFVGTQYLFSQSLRYISPVIFSLLMALTPIVVLVLSAVFLKEKLLRRKLLGSIISISGAFLIILQSHGGAESSDGVLGIIFSLLCVLAYAVYMILTREVSKKYHPLTIVKWMFLVSAIVIAPSGFSEFPNQVVYSSDATITGYLLLAFALLFSTLIAFFMMPVALKRLEAGTVSIFMNLQPIIASVAAIAVGQDMFSWDKPVAAFLVLFGVYMVTSAKNNQKVKEFAIKHASR